ncbi:MAG: helix-turn-helix transcriptional regulator [Steroidobacteraceae bacterium]|nr:helix-turn-helix transcriptional regulator [Steroidobacteraceae bacterium]
MMRARKIPANSVARALAKVGDRWSLLILGSAFQGAKRFDDWQRGIGISSNILTNRLNHLVRIGCLERVPGGGSRSAGYRLTSMGADLYPVALMFWRFDRQWSTNRALKSATLTHGACGCGMTPVLVCARCREPLHARDVRYEPGPGAALERMPPPKVSRRSLVTLDGAQGPGLFGDSIDYFGDRWTQLVIASAFLGLRRFSDIQERWKIAPNILADRLKLLVDQGMLERRAYQANPERFEYRLTPKGMDIYPILLALMRWGDRWLATKAGAPLILHHRGCGRRLDPLAVCDHCGGVLDRHDVELRPGAPPAAAQAARGTGRRVRRVP